MKELRRMWARIFGPDAAEIGQRAAETEQADRAAAEIVRRLQAQNENNARVLGLSVGEALADAFRRGQQEGQRHHDDR